MQYRESPSDNWQPLVIQANMNWASMADIYDPVNGSYEYGEYVLYNGAMYRCISTTGASGTWDSTKWMSVSVGDELASFIIISDTQPTETSNKIWIKESSAQDPVQIPTMAEFSALESDVVDISDDVDAIENTLNQLDSDDIANASSVSGETVTAALNILDAAVAEAATNRIYALRKYTGSGKTFTITFPEYGAYVHAFMFGRFGYAPGLLSMAIVSHSSSNSAEIKCFGDQTATVTCAGNVVTVTTAETYAEVTVLSIYNIS
jgi:hypothetical protein